MKKLLIGILATSLIAGSAIAVETGAKKENCKYRHHEQIEKALSELPKDKATLVRNWMQQMKQERKASHKQLKGLYQQVKELAAAEKFDKEAFLAKMAQIRQLKDQRALKYAEAAANVAAQLTAKERTTLLKAFSKGQHGYHATQGGQHSK
ncbi:MAG: periplasmic heavy metal sensor [Candidatus Nitrosoglobus sp.]|jgi:Spy/CpxP family protein refolding chaperone